MVYVPLSIQMPGYVKELQAKQSICAEHRAWWPCHKASTDHIAEHAIVLGPCGVPTQSSVELQDEISAAIEAPLSSNPQTPSPRPSFHPQVKTSATHPIK